MDPIGSKRDARYFGSGQNQRKRRTGSAVTIVSDFVPPWIGDVSSRELLEPSAPELEMAFLLAGQI